jgi:hypothetical protein
MLTAVVVVPSPSPLLPVSTPRAVARGGSSWVAGLVVVVVVVLVLVASLGMGMSFQAVASL